MDCVNPTIWHHWFHPEHLDTKLIGMAWQKENGSICKSSLTEQETQEGLFLKSVSLLYTHVDQNRGLYFGVAAECKGWAPGLSQSCVHIGRESHSLYWIAFLLEKKINCRLGRGTGLSKMEVLGLVEGPGAVDVQSASLWSHQASGDISWTHPNSAWSS